MGHLCALAALLVLWASPAMAAPEALQSVVVQPGDTLWAIANTYLKDPTRWNEILPYNRLPTSDPTVALPGMTLKVPVALIKESLRSGVLVRLVNEVLYRRRQTADWAAARLNMQLYPQDGLRTMADSEARVRFIGGQVLTVSPNSMVILNPERRDTDLELIQGEIRNVSAKVLTAGAQILPRAKDTAYSARIKDDLSTQVQVYKGAAQVEAKGKSVEVAAGFAVDVPFDMPPSAPLPLPEPGQIRIIEGLLPGPWPAGLPLPGAGVPAGGPRETGSTLVVLEGTKLSVKVPAGAAPPLPAAGAAALRPPAQTPAPQPVTVGTLIQEYHLQVSRDPEFKETLVDRRFSVLEDVDLKRLSLPEARLWWRVAMVDLLGFEGAFTQPQRLDLKALTLEVRSPREGERVATEILTISGDTLPGARVSVNAQPASVDAAGRFSLAVALDPGSNVLRVRAEALGQSVEVVRTVTQASP